MEKTPEQIHYNMSRIHSKDTGIEVALRKELWFRGLRYRKNVKGIPGKPDIAFIGKKIAVFCDSEFWHGYDWENRRDDIHKNQEFWIKKIERNMERDREVNEQLSSMGWTVIRFWGNDIKKDVAGCADIVEKEVREVGEIRFDRPVRRDRRYQDGVRECIWRRDQDCFRQRMGQVRTGDLQGQLQGPTRD